MTKNDKKCETNETCPHCLKREKRMFTDYTKIIIKSGNGGNGAATFRREKYVAAGGPDRTEMEEMEEISIFKLIKIKIHW